MKRFATPLLGVAIFALNVVLNAPLFMPGELPFRGSIEGGYVAMARFLSEHPNPWGWNPLQYCGLPVQFMYVPLLPYLSAFWMRLLPHATPDTVYRVIVDLFTCLGPVTLFVFALHFTGSRRWALGAALVYSLFSPSYGLFPAIEKDRGIVQLPWRIQVLAKYGEGPHDTALTLLPLTLLALWHAARARTYHAIFLAAVLLAAIPLANWVGAFSLAICALLLLIAAWGDPRFQVWRALAAAALAYLLACFWLTPAFIRTIVFNWPVDSFAYRLGKPQLWLIAAAAAGVILIRLLFHIFRGSFYFCLVTLGAFVFGWIATVYYIYGVDVIPESRRYAIEFEFWLVLALAEAARLAWRTRNGTVRLCAAASAMVMLVVGAPQLYAYLTQGWTPWRPSPPETTVEYRLAKWIAEHPPQGRVFASGGLRFRLNSWFDIPQVGGGFETGLQNRAPHALAYRIRAGQTDDTLGALQALGTQYVVIHGAKSREYYRDFVRPERVANVLPAVYRIEDDTIYALPARSLADTLGVHWPDPSTLILAGPAPGGKPVDVRINAGPGWHATQDGHEIPWTRDELGFMVLHPAASAATRIVLHYRGTAEQRIMAAISGLTWLAALAVLATRKTTPPSRSPVA